MQRVEGGDLRYYKKCNKRIQWHWMVRHGTDRKEEMHGFEVGSYTPQSVSLTGTSLIVSYKTLKPSISEMPRSPVRITYRTHFPQYKQQLRNFTLSIIVDPIFDYLGDNFILALRVVVQFSTSCPTLELWGSPSRDIRQKTAREIFQFKLCYILTDELDLVPASASRRDADTVEASSQA
jgi:hypothetical protein